MSTSPSHSGLCQEPPATEALLMPNSIPRSINPQTVNNENDNGVTTDQSKPLRGHRRQQASIGLGIITTNLDITNNKKEGVAGQDNAPKNDAFFSTTLPLPRPPPSLRINESPSQPPVERTSLDLEEEELVGSNRRVSLASRLRSLVAANKSGTTPVPSPIPNNYMHGRDSSNNNKLSAPRSYSDDEIMPLPSPAPGSSSPSSAHYHKQHHLFPKHRVVSPPQLSPVTPDADDNDSPPSPTASTSIPVIAVSPSLTPDRKNKLPSLREEPMLGDLDDKTYHQGAGGLVVPMMREYKFPSPSPLRYNEEDIVGKQIGDYRIGKLLGVGAFSKVYVATHLHTGVQYAIKMVNKERIAKDARVRSSIEREVGVLRFIDHPLIVRLEATMETEMHLCIVMEYAQGGELFEFVQRMHQRLHANGHARVDEQLVKRIFLELVRTVQWMHDHSIIHRDLKLENILIHMDESGSPRLKVTDFGLARVIDPNDPILTTRCGSEEYAAPEIVQSMGYDGRQTDTWALGVILYALLVGYLPFMYNPGKGEKVSHLFYRIVSGDYKWPSDWNQHPERAVSNEAKQVVDCILKRHPHKRIALADIETLPWFSDC
ncbi:kinase-like domain-containing protein [Fennellomyces sp. T-0311]|nr:kinase-like domain-containing protein [Fennellomyces sp. T-0311]